MNKVSIVFTCDNNYAMPFAIALQSLLESKNEDSFYNIYCLVPSEFSKNNLSKISQLEAKYTNYKLNFIEVGKELSNSKCYIERIPYVAYFRLLLPNILSKHDKCIYIDVDTIIKYDLSGLFNTNIDNYYIGAVKHPLLLHRTTIKNYKTSGNCYFNAGVLLMNLELMRKDNKQQEFVKLIEEDFPIMDQDLLNVSCDGKVKFLELKYNMMTRLCELSELIRGYKVYSKNFRKSVNNPVIIHYANKEKPWDYKNLYYNQDWDDIYKISPFFENEVFSKRKKINKIKHNFGFFINNLKRELLKNKLIFKLNEYMKKKNNNEKN